MMLTARIVCKECIEEDELKSVKENELVLKSEETLIFCDRCEEQQTAE
jgi:hypothetical protein